LLIYSREIRSYDTFIELYIRSSYNHPLLLSGVQYWTLAEYLAISSKLHANI